MTHKALIIGNGKSIIGFDPLTVKDGYDLMIGCNHAWQQWPYLDWYCMADERNVIYTKEQGKQFWSKIVTKSMWHTRHKLDWPGHITHGTAPKCLNVKRLEQQGQWLLERKDISGTLAIRWAREMGATHIDCIGFDSLYPKHIRSWDKAYTDVPWEKRTPGTNDRWQQAMDSAVKEVSPIPVRIVQKPEDLQNNINTIQET